MLSEKGVSDEQDWLAGVEYDSERNTLRGKVLRAPGATGKIFVYAPRGFRSREALPVTANTNGGAVYELPVRLGGPAQEFCINIQKE